MTCALERGLFVLAECRLLLLELRDAERRLRTLADDASAAERPLLDEGIEALGEAVAAGRSACGRIEELVPDLEAMVGPGGRTEAGESADDAIS